MSPVKKQMAMQRLGESKFVYVQSSPESLEIENGQLSRYWKMQKTRGSQPTG